MKKKLIGFAAMGLLMFSGYQAQATLITDINAIPITHTGSMKFLSNIGYDSTTNVGGTNYTYGILNVTQVYVPGNAAFSTWNAHSGDNIFIIFSGIKDTLTPGTLTGGAFAIYETPSNDSLTAVGGSLSNLKAAFADITGGLGYNDGIFKSTAGSTELLLSGTLSSEFYTPIGPGLTAGFTGYGTSVAGDLLPYFSPFLTVQMKVNGNYDNRIGVPISLNDGSITAAVPEPATMLLFGTGLIGLAGIGRRKLRK